MDLLQLIADRQIGYHPRWREVTGSATATILLRHLINLWVKKGRRPFYKFSSACNHRLYRPGDSLEEELGFSKKELLNAKKKIAIRTKKKMVLHPDHLVSYSVVGNQSYYILNEKLITEKLGQLYSYPQENGIQPMLIPEVPKGNFIEMPNGDSIEVPKGNFTQTTEVPKGDSIEMPKGNFIEVPKGDSIEVPKGNFFNYIVVDSVVVDESKTTTEGAGALTKIILAWMGFSGKLSTDEQAISPALFLAWAMWCRAGPDVKNPPGLARSAWREGAGPGASFEELALWWLAADDDERWTLLKAAPNKGLLDLPPSGIGAVAAKTFYELYSATSGQPVPDVLMPRDVPD